jgi:hypothetical protein
MYTKNLTSLVYNQQLSGSEMNPPPPSSDIGCDMVLPIQVYRITQGMVVDETMADWQSAGEKRRNAQKNMF